MYKNNEIWLFLLSAILFLASCHDNGPQFLSPENPKNKWESLSTPWYLFGKNGINIKPAWDITTGSEKVTVAVIDGGFSADNPAFSQGICLAKKEYFNFLSQQPNKAGDHGTQVASLINTCDDNPLELIGINRNSRILWLEGQDTPLSQMMVVRWAFGAKNACIHSQLIRCSSDNSYPAHVINISLGAQIKGHSDYYKNKWSTLYVTKEANDKGSIIVASAGNEGQNADFRWPSAMTGVISVGATNQNGDAWRQSNWGETVEIMAPGTDILVASINQKTIVNGTSFATPIVSGVVSLMRSVYAELNWKTASYILQSTAIKMDCHSYCIADRTKDAQTKCRQDCCKGDKQVCTTGRLDAGAAVARAQQTALHGLPAIALVDADKYFVHLNGKKGAFKLFNVGGAKGSYKISSPDGSLLFNNRPEQEIVLGAKGTANDTVNISFVATTKFSLEALIRIASPESGLSDDFTDEMNIYVGEDTRITH